MRESIMPVYAPPKVLFTHGKGVYLYSSPNTKHLDFTAGIAVNSLGHCHKDVVNTLQAQSEKLWHLSNMFRIEPAEILADKITKLTFADTVFFTNSGAEANECGLKIIRRYHFDKGSSKTRIIGMTNSFHGRTIATVCASGNKDYIKGFVNGDQGYDQVEFGNIESLKAMISNKTAGIILEPIQGEGGIKVADIEYLKQVRKLCDENDIVLMFDEVQCGVGRTGYLYAYQALGVTPDILSSAKGIGAGFPLGACISKKQFSDCMVVGTHGSTYGGNALATAVGNTVLDIISKENFLKNVLSIGNYFREQLEKLSLEYPQTYGEVTGLGLMLGIKVTPENTKILIELRDKYNILVVKAGGNSLRFVPPLIIEKKHIDELIKCLKLIAKT